MNRAGAKLFVRPVCSLCVSVSIAAFSAHGQSASDEPSSSQSSLTAAIATASQQLPPSRFGTSLSLLAISPLPPVTPLLPAGESSTAQSNDPQANPGEANPAPPEAASDDSVTFFPHSETSRYWISGQANFVSQGHPPFPAAYTGPNSLLPVSEEATSRVFTLYTGYELTSTTEVYLDIESAGGHGISRSLGLAGYTDLDVVRVGLTDQTPYVARAMIRQIIPLSTDRVPEERDATSFTLANTVPARRIEIRAGKFSAVDFFDTNTYASDSHLQFLNWAVDTDAAYDYAANTRGYTDGAFIEYDDHWFAVRFGEMLMPKIANGIYLDADFARAGEQGLEFDFTGNRLFHRSGTLGLMSYLNTADMGNYEQAIEEYLDGQTSTPNIITTRRQGRHRYGFDLNFEQEVAPSIAFFGRLGWSDGRNESFAYTECDRTLELGGFSYGNRWHRRNDRAGVAFLANGIIKAHQQYLALGGLGFQLGDGGLTYGPEEIVEAFYTAHIWRGLFLAPDLQHINNPGYNRVRGPVFVPGLRLHVDF
jgi:high affinity Mn2+ porin